MVVGLLSRRNLFLVMEYLPGGDFMSLLECIVQLEEQVARVYIAEIALALNHLHSKGCVHRYVVWLGAVMEQCDCVTNVDDLQRSEAR